MLNVPRSFIISITLRVIQSSGQAELACPVAFAFYACLPQARRPDVFYRDGEDRLVRRRQIICKQKKQVWYQRVKV